jgi:hypothetical protein
VSYSVTFLVDTHAQSSSSMVLDKTLDRTEWGVLSKLKLSFSSMAYLARIYLLEKMVDSVFLGNVYKLSVC